MKPLHILQGDPIGDKKWLEKAAREGLDSQPKWVAPKSSKPGDDIVMYVAGYGFFATAIIKSFPKPRLDWPGHRYGVALTSIRLIEPAISLYAIRRRVPELTWAIYPRSITTPDPSVAVKIRDLISVRRKSGVPDLDDDSIKEANLDELRKIALLKAKRSATAKEQKIIYRARSLAIKQYVLRRSNGICEGCNQPAPFVRPDGSFYFEPHHTTRLADDGPDDPRFVIALCPNCHRRAHYSADANAFQKHLVKVLSVLEPA